MRGRVEGPAVCSPANRLTIPGVTYAMNFKGLYGGARLSLLLTADQKAELEKLRGNIRN